MGIALNRNEFAVPDDKSFKVICRKAKRGRPARRKGALERDDAEDSD